MFPRRHDGRRIPAQYARGADIMMMSAPLVIAQPRQATSRTLSAETFDAIAAHKPSGSACAPADRMLDWLHDLYPFARCRGQSGAVEVDEGLMPNNVWAAVDLRCPSCGEIVTDAVAAIAKRLRGATREVVV